MKQKRKKNTLKSHFNWIFISFLFAWQTIPLDYHHVNVAIIFSECKFLESLEFVSPETILKFKVDWLQIISLHLIRCFEEETTHSNIQAVSALSIFAKNIFSFKFWPCLDIANRIGILWVFDLTTLPQKMQSDEFDWRQLNFWIVSNDRMQCWGILVEKLSVECTAFASVVQYDRHLSAYFITITVIIISINWRQRYGFRHSLHRSNYNSALQTSVAEDKQCRFNDIDRILQFVRSRCNELQHLLVSHGCITKSTRTDSDIAIYSCWCKRMQNIRRIFKINISSKILTEMNWLHSKLFEFNRLEKRSKKFLVMIFRLFDSKCKCFDWYECNTYQLCL